MTRNQATRAVWAGAVVAGLVASAPLAAHDHDTTGPAVTAAFAPDGRLWRVATSDHSLLVDSSTDLGLSFGPPVVIEPARQRLHADAEGPAPGGTSRSAS